MEKLFSLAFDKEEVKKMNKFSGHMTEESPSRARSAASASDCARGRVRRTRAIAGLSVKEAGAAERASRRLDGGRARRVRPAVAVLRRR